MGLGGVVRLPAGLAPTRVVLFDRQQGWLLRGALCSIASGAGCYGGCFVQSPAGLAATGGVLFIRQQGWLLRGVFCSIASRAGCYGGCFVQSPAGLAPTGAEGGVGKTNRILLRRALRRAYSQPLRLKNAYGRTAAASMTPSAAG